MLVTLGVCADGSRVVLDLRLAGVGESEQAWLDAVRSLFARHLGSPLLAVIDGNPVLAAALRARSAKITIQRCTNHKLWNLLAKAPAHLREELAEDYRRMIYAESREAGRGDARVGFLRKWKLRCKAGSASFEEAGDQLFTFTAFPMFTMESAAHHQCAGADQRGVPAAHQNPGFAPQRGGGSAPALRAAAQRPGDAPPPRRLARPNNHQ